MRAIDGDALLKRVQQEKIQAQVHGREFSTCFMNPGGTPSTEWWFVEDLIENAPTIVSEPCEDAVSRADVEIEIANLLKGVFVEYEDIAKKVAVRLPSVTPKRKTGRWIKIMDGNAYRDKCNRCSEIYPNAYGYNFCPNCGLKMEE